MTFEKTGTRNLSSQFSTNIDSGRGTCQDRRPLIARVERKEGRTMDFRAVVCSRSVGSVINCVEYDRILTLCRSQCSSGYNS